MLILLYKTNAGTKLPAFFVSTTHINAADSITIFIDVNYGKFTFCT